MICNYCGENIYENQAHSCEAGIILNSKCVEETKTEEDN